MEKLINLIDELIFKYPNLTDIHISEDENIVVREFGNLNKTDEFTDKEFFNDMFFKTLDEKKRNIYEIKNSLDFSISKNSYRLRFHVYKSCSKNCISIRVLPKLCDIKLEDEEIIEEIANLTSGIVIISGPSGSGKSTFLAKILDYINEKKSKHCITIEDPIEYEFKSKTSLIHQREIGLDVKDFHTGVLESLREDMNVLLLGEMRDENTIKAALLASQTGHLVLTTLHNKDTTQAIGRITNALKDEKEVRQILSSQLRYVISQKLYFHNRKLLTVREILKNTKPISRLIRDGKDEQIKSYLEMNNNGMKTMKQSAMKIARDEKMNTRETEKLLNFVNL